MEKSLIIRVLSRQEPDFYCLMGPIFGSRAIARELQLPVFDDPDRIWIVALANRTVVGCTSVIVHPPRALFKSAWVDPAWRGQRIFDTLFQERLRLAQTLGATIAQATVTTRSRHTYDRYGFTVIGHRGQYAIMTKTLGGAPHV